MAGGSSGFGKLYRNDFSCLHGPVAQHWVDWLELLAYHGDLAARPFKQEFVDKHKCATCKHCESVLCPLCQTCVYNVRVPEWRTGSGELSLWWRNTCTYASK